MERPRLQYQPSDAECKEWATSPVAKLFLHTLTKTYDKAMLAAKDVTNTNDLVFNLGHADGIEHVYDMLIDMKEAKVDE